VRAGAMKFTSRIWVGLVVCRGLVEPREQIGCLVEPREGVGCGNDRTDRLLGCAGALRVG
jgi:hypothetical protein